MTPTATPSPDDDYLGPPPLPPTSNRQPIAGGDLTSRAITRVEPTYPAAGRAVRASGPVTVEIIVGEDGSVVWASAISGHVILRPAAIAVVRRWQFSPTQVSGQPVRTRGTVTVNFTLQ